MNLITVISLIVWLLFSSVSYAADLSQEDIMKCHQYSALAAKYQMKKQAGITLEHALKGIDDSAEISLATQVYKDIDKHYNVAQIRKELFEHCAKSFSEFRENERTS